jgi:hypothetical protein
VKEVSPSHGLASGPVAVSLSGQRSRRIGGDLPLRRTFGASPWSAAAQLRRQTYRPAGIPERPPLPPPTGTDVARLARLGPSVYRQASVDSKLADPRNERAGAHSWDTPLLVDLRRQFSNSSPAAKSLVKRLLQRVGRTDQMRTDPKFEDARGPNVRELRQVQRRLSPVEVEALLADYEAGRHVGELARVYGIHRSTVSAHAARASNTRGNASRTGARRVAARNP